MLRFLYYFLVLFFLACEVTPSTTPQNDTPSSDDPYLLVLGIAQDAGYPQANCQKDCCQRVWKGEVEPQMVSCLALIDPRSQKAWIFDATPDFPAQWQLVKEELPGVQLAGIFLTHAHIGHYTGLMHLGREVMGAEQIPVFSMPRMQTFLQENGPWSQLVLLENISLQAMEADSTVSLSDRLQVTPLAVPHRDEFSETVGFRIHYGNKKALFIPDIDKWQLWERDINQEIAMVDYAFLDATFYQNGEIPGRDMSQIPHPFVQESLAKFKNLSAIERAKVRFIHLNHTNPLLLAGSAAQKAVSQAGCGLAQIGEHY